MKVYRLVSRHGYDSKARNPQLTHYTTFEDNTLSLLCGRTLVPGVHIVKEVGDQTTIATCKRCLERAAKRVMLNKQEKPKLTIDFETIEARVAGFLMSIHPESLSPKGKRK